MPDARMVVGAHNAHIQKTPVVYDGYLTGLPMGQHLHRALGDEYVAIAITSADGRTAEMHVDEGSPFGFYVEDARLESPEPGSIEAAFVEAGITRGMVSAREIPPPVRASDTAPDRIRMQSS